MPSLFVVAGDPSGDAHAARLVTALRQRVPGLTVAGLGGPALRAVGADLWDDLTAAASIGPFDAARHLSRFARAKRLFAEHLASARPDLVLLVDFGDFNLPILAPIAKRAGVRVAYYISPQLWAWGRWRLRFVRQHVDRMLVLFKFEEEFYQRAGVPVTWVGHPLLEEAVPALPPDQARERCGLNPWRMTVGLLPGSRSDEVRRHLGLMLAAAKRLAWQMPGVQFLIQKAPGVPRQDMIATAERAGVDAMIAEGRMADALQLMDAAIVTSGTATLETALAGVPMTVVYRTSWPTYLMAKSVLRIPDIALVNIVAGRRLVPELVQHQATPKRIAGAMLELLRSREQRESVRAGLREVREKLGSPGAVDRAAEELAKLLPKR